MLESNIINDNLLIDILSVWRHRKNIKMTHAYHSATSKAILTKCLCNLNVYILYLRFALESINGDRCERKTPKQFFIQVKPPFSVVEISNTVTFLMKCSFWRHINVSYNYQTGFSSPIVFCILVACWHRYIKTLSILSLTRLIALEVVMSSLTSTQWRQ